MIEIGGSDWFIQVVQITYDFEQGILLLDGFVFHGVCQSANLGSYCLVAESVQFSACRKRVPPPWLYKEQISSFFLSS
jgi:hypothetical protein